LPHLPTHLVCVVRDANAMVNAMRRLRRRLEQIL
jgi:hypothetical protein